jgi:outer membrane receptor protein involved in Fe transport
MKLTLSAVIVSALIVSLSVVGAEKLNTGTIEVISATPLPSIGLPIDQVPSNVQVIKGSDLKSQQSLNLADYLNNNLSGVNVNEAQNNPYQADVNYHGFTASPLLGTPQGLSVYQDGVRINEPFGDTVNWDLIPKNAISNIALMPGSNPLFGLNTLGGALSINTKNGDQYPGFGAQAYAGSWGRWAVEGEGGGKLDNGANYFFAGNKFKETGWRDSSPSDVLQGFGKLGWSNEKTRFDLSFSGADNSLVGNGYQAETLMQNLGYNSIYTKPDQTKNKMSFINLNMSHSFSNQLLLSANVYYRHTKTSTMNADVNDLYESLYEACLHAVDDSGCSSEYNQGANNRSKTQNNGFGSTVQLSWITDKNVLTSGISYVGSRVKFTQTEEEFSAFSSSRGASGTLHPIETVNDLKGNSNTWSLFATDTYNVTPKLALTASGRYNYTKNKLTDNLVGHKEGTCIADADGEITDCEDLTLSGPGKDGTLVQAAAGDAGGKHQYSRLNPAIGFAYAFMPTLNGYAGYNEGSRAPSPIENGCADPAYPCLLPNAMAGDPPLKQVVTKTFEAGFRGKFNGNIRWSAGAYKADNFNDIQFIASGTTGAGYFNNVGKTRRQGLDLAMSGAFDKFNLHLGYSFIDATYESTFDIASQANSSRVTVGDATFITVNPGNKMVGIPEHQLKLRGEWFPNSNFMLGASLVAFSDQYARGNENNKHVADNSTYFGSGKVAGYSVLNLDARYNFSNSGGWQLFAKANNVFDHKYYTSGLLGENIFNGTGNTFKTDADSHKELFLAPGAPRALWIGLRYDFGGAQKSGASD